MKINRKKFARWTKVAVILYCGMGILVYYTQELFLFMPKKLPADHQFKFDIPFEEVSIPLSATSTISMVKFHSAIPVTKGLLIYYHGNKKNIERYAPYVKNFTQRGYEVWMPDYPGYGKSKGERTEQSLYDMALQVRKLAAKTFSSDSVIVYGKSLGTGIAAYVASVTDNKELILETPYYSIPALMNAFTFIYPTTFMSNFKLPTGEFLDEVTEKVIIFHGTNDWMIPYRCAARLKKHLKPGDEFITIKNGTHNNLTGTELYQHKLDSLFR